MSTTKIPDGYLADSRGRLVPIDTISEQDKRRDALVKELLAEALELEELIASKRVSMQERVDAYLEWRKGVAKVKRENWKGNIQLDSFDGGLRVDRRVKEVINFNEDLQLAKTVIDDWMKDNLKGSSDELRAVVMDAFSVDQKGNVNRSQILRLLRLDIQGAKWKKAMDLIKGAMQTQMTRQTTTFYIRGEQGEFRQVILAFGSSEIQYDESAERDG
jgi:hypothetical protein